jgi:PAS domain S-box-containing protein
MFARIHPDDRALVIAALERTIRDGAPYGLEHRIVLRDGTERVVFQRDDVVFANGRPCRLVGSVQDITERKRIELELPGCWCRPGQRRDKRNRRFVRATSSCRLRLTS